MKKILITGGNGFIGSALALSLFKQGHQVYIIDKAEEAHQILQDYKYSICDDQVLLTQLKDNLQMITYDLLDITPNIMKATFNTMDLVIHLASPIGVDNIIQNSNKTLIDALKINLLIQETCESLNIPLIYSSSSEVFGSGEVTETSSFSIKQPEDNPRWSYAAQKVAGEFLFATSSFPSTTIRFFNIIGPGQTTPGMITVEMMNAAIAGTPINIRENGIRNYCYIDDACTQILMISDDLLKNHSNSIYNKKSFNIGSGKDDNTLSAEEFAFYVKQVTGSNSEIIKQASEEVLPIRILKSAPLAQEKFTTIYTSLTKIYNYRRNKHGTNSSNE
jgi:nucleoside-diphosphate-sugar epimerase